CLKQRAVRLFCGESGNGREQLVRSSLYEPDVHDVQSVHEAGVGARRAEVTNDREQLVGGCLGRVQLAADELKPCTSEHDARSTEGAAGSHAAFDLTGLGL